jgi:uncharacterized membrane protein
MHAGTVTEAGNPHATRTGGPPAPVAGDSPAPGLVRAARLTGVDIARSLAIIGMIVVHTGVPFLSGDLADGIHQLARGRSAALFAFLAGLSLALISGRREPARGPAGRAAAVKVATRALILLIAGSFLATLDSGVAVILNYYGFFFLLALPLLRLRAGALAAVAVLLAATGPQLSFLLRWAFESGPLPYSWIDSVNAADPIKRLAGEGVLDFLLFGSYPALTFLAFLAAGLAVGRLDLSSDRIRLRLLALGAALTALGYGTAAIALHRFGLVDRLSGSEGAVPTATATGVERQLGQAYGTVPADDPGWLLIATPHSGTTFEVVGATGVALIVLAGCLLVGDRLGRWMYPLAAVGSMALTVYTAHVLMLAWINADGSPVGFLSDVQPEFFVLGSVLFATAWRLALGRGPLERLLGAAASGAARLATRGTRRAVA